MSFQLHTVDILIILFYIVSMVVIGIKLAGTSHNAEEYFLAGRSMIWPIVGISLFASNISSTTLIGLSGDAYGKGISVYNYEWMAAVVLAFFAVFFLPFYLRSKIYTIPEYLERRFNPSCRYYFSAITIFANIIIDTAAGLYSGGIVLRMIFPNIPLWMMVIILALVAGAYTIMGGLTAVMITDVIQTVILLGGSILITLFALIMVKEQGGWAAVTQAAAQKGGSGMLSLWRPLDDPNVPWLGLLTGVPLLGFYFWCTNQFMVQRVLSSKSIQHGQWGALFAGLLKLPVLFIMVLPGTMAILLFPDVPKQDMIYPTLIFSLLPVGIRGLVIAGLIAALMSSIDSTLNSASTLVTMDFVKKIKPQLSSPELMKAGRIATFIIMLLAAAWAPFIEKFGSLFQYLQAVLSYIIPPVMSLFLVGFFWKKANGKGAVAAIISGIIVGMALLILKVTGTWNLHFLYAAMVLFLICCTVLILVSLLTAKSWTKDVSQLTWNKMDFRKETLQLKELAWYQNYRFLASGLIIVTFLTVVWFWL